MEQKCWIDQDTPRVVESIEEEEGEEEEEEEEEELKRIKIVGWKAKVEDRQDWNRIVEQWTDQDPPRVVEPIEEEEEE